MYSQIYIKKTHTHHRWQQICLVLICKYMFIFRCKCTCVLKITVAKKPFAMTSIPVLPIGLVHFVGAVSKVIPNPCSKQRVSPTTSAHIWHGSGVLLYSMGSFTSCSSSLKKSVTHWWRCSLCGQGRRLRLVLQYFLKHKPLTPPLPLVIYVLPWNDAWLLITKMLDAGRVTVIPCNVQPQVRCKARDCRKRRSKKGPFFKYLCITYR